MSYFPLPDIHIREKLKVLLSLSNYATKKELEHATGIEISILPDEKKVIVLKVEANKLDIKILVDLKKFFRLEKNKWRKEIWTCKRHKI